jgi:hypothetical protein
MLSAITAIKNTLRRSPFRRIVMSRRHTGLTETDAFLASYPRSGNTWLKSLLTSCIFGEAMQNFSDRVDPVIPIVGYHRNVKPLVKAAGRIIKTHESFRPEYQKAIWIVRDPRDVVISEFKLEQRSQTFTRSFEDYITEFTKIRRHGPPDWKSHTQSWLDSPLCGSQALLAVRFEDLRLNTASELKRVLDFLELDSNESILEKALQQNSLSSMSDRHALYDRTLGKSVNSKIPAVNQGMPGGWKYTLTPDAIKQIEKVFGETLDALGYIRSAS